MWRDVHAMEAVAWVWGVWESFPLGVINPLGGINAEKLLLTGDLLWSEEQDLFKEIETVAREQET